MNHAQRASAPGKPRIWLWFAAIGVLGLLMLLTLLGAWRARQQGDVSREVAEIADRGEPMGANELESFYASPPVGEDMTKLWLDGLAPLVLPAFTQGVSNVPIVGKTAEIPPPGQPWSDLAVAEKLLAQYQSSLALLHQAAAGGGAARYPTSFKNGFAMPLPHVQDLRNASRLLVLEAHVKAHRGDAQGAVQSIETALAAGESLKNEPILISQFVRVACGSSARSHFRELLPHVAFAEEDLLRLQEKLAAIDYRSGLRRGLLAERAIGSMALEDPAQFETAGPPQGASLIFPLFRAGAQQVYLDRMQQTLMAVDLPWPQALAENSRIEAELAADTESAAIFSQLKYTLANLVACATDACFKSAARHTADNDATIAIIAIERYRRQHGQLPAYLTQLVPELITMIPLDPFNGQPLKYVPGQNGYIIYNVGEDGIDNGGQGDDSGRPDDVLRIEYPTAESDGAERP